MGERTDMFQFTHPGGVRLLGPAELGSLALFQFTHPGGVRLIRFFGHVVRGGFNSRTREGCDGWYGAQACGAPQFQFTHPGGVRPPIATPLDVVYVVSIHAPGRGATSD